MHSTQSFAYWDEVHNITVRIDTMNKQSKKFFFIKMDYNNDMDNPQVGTFDEFNEIEEEMIEILIDKSENVKLYFCDNVKNISQDKKSVLAGSFLEPKKFFKENFTKEYKEFCHKYKLLLDK